jgi:hypothetical protein
MLSNNLNTNEVKNAAGAEVEFQHLSYPTPTSREFAAIGEAYNLPHRLRVAHREVGSGLTKRRQSNVRIAKSVAGVSGEVRQVICNISVDIPIGDLNSNDEVENVLAEMGSFCFLTGANDTFIYAGTGNGSVALKDGSL